MVRKKNKNKEVSPQAQTCYKNQKKQEDKMVIEIKEEDGVDEKMFEETFKEIVLNAGEDAIIQVQCSDGYLLIDKNKKTCEVHLS